MRVRAAAIHFMIAVVADVFPGMFSLSDFVRGYVNDVEREEAAVNMVDKSHLNITEHNWNCLKAGRI